MNIRNLTLLGTNFSLYYDFLFISLPDMHHEGYKPVFLEPVLRCLVCHVFTYHRCPSHCHGLDNLLFDSCLKQEFDAADRTSYIDDVFALARYDFPQLNLLQVCSHIQGL